MYYVIDPKVAAVELTDEFKTIDEVKAHCKSAEGEYVIVKIIGRAKTQRVEKVKSEFDLSVRKSKEVVAPKQK